MGDQVKFEAFLEKHDSSEATGIYIPFDVEKVFGAKRVPVKVLINEVEHHSTVVRMGGKYLMVVPKVFRDAAGIKAGDKITVEMEKDSEKRSVEIPKDLNEALQKNDLTEAFAKMSYTHRKEFVNAVNEAKKEETRVRRIEKIIEQLRSKRK